MHKKQIKSNEVIHPIQMARDFFKDVVLSFYKRMFLFSNWTPKLVLTSCCFLEFGM